MNIATTSAIGIIALAAGSSLGAITVSQGSSAITYSTTLNFDELGGPTGAVSTDAWAALGVTELQSGDGAPSVGDNSGAGPWIGTSNSFFGNFGIFMTFDSDLTNFSAQIWDPSGPGSFFGGGMIGVAFNDGVEVGSFFSDGAGSATSGGTSQQPMEMSSMKSAFLVSGSPQPPTATICRGTLYPHQAALRFSDLQASQPRAVVGNELSFHVLQHGVALLKGSAAPFKPRQTPHRPFKEILYVLHPKQSSLRTDVRRGCRSNRTGFRYIPTHY